MYNDLLGQARKLARLDPKKPRQVNLRRAVSAAYYGLFHFLIDQSCRAVVGAQHDQAPYRQVLGRAFSHTTMKDACTSFAGGTLKDAVKKGLPSTFSIPVDVRRIAATFVDLQDSRHVADYDLTDRFSRSEVLGLIQEAEAAIQRFKQLATSDEKAFFLACLWAWTTLSRR
jgi:uncharacterized protein (UPF0332 family)